MFRAAAAAAMRKKDLNAAKQKIMREAKMRMGKGGDLTGYEGDLEGRYRSGSAYSDDESEIGEVTFNIEDDLRIKVTESLRKKEKAVHFKDDKDRFPQQFTLKLRKEGKYRISVEVVEGVHVLYIKVGGILFEEPEVEKSGEKVTYSFAWNTDKMDLVGDHYRAVYPSMIKLKMRDEDEEIKFDLMLKFYKHENNKNKKERYTSGPQLQYISLEADSYREDVYKPMFNEVVRTVWSG